MKIGVIISGLFEEYNRNICKSIEMLSQDDDNEVVIITGKYLGYDLTKELGMIYEYQYNSSFCYAELMDFDGLIIEMASVTMFCSPSQKKKFINRFKDVPHVFIGYEQEGYGSAIIDNKAGLLEGLEELYKLGARKYAMIGGPADNYDAISRKDAFLEFLESHGLEFTDKMYEDGDFIISCKYKIERLIDNNPDLDALICANDVLGRQACDILEARGIIVGRDISVLGYDNSYFATNSKPTLCTVNNDFYKLGESAYRMLIDIINGGKAEQIRIPTNFVRRESFVKREGEYDSTIKMPELEIMLGKDIVTTDPRVNDAREAYRELQYFTDNVGKLYDQGEDVMKRAVTTMGAAYDKRITNIIDMEKTHSLICDIWDREQEACNDIDKLKTINRVFKMINKNLFSALYSKQENMRAELINGDSFRQRFFVDTFRFEHGDDMGYAQILSMLNVYDIKNAYLYMYQDVIYNFPNDNFEVPDKLLLKAVIEDGMIETIPGTKQKVAKKDILHKISVNGNKKPMVLLPIFCDEILYGIMLCDLKTEHYLSSGIIVSQISAAVRMLYMLRTNETLLAKYENMLHVLKSNNIELDKLSKRDSLTGLVNRRGYEVATDELYKKLQREGKRMYVLYADMNNLKIINDKFGHSEGDYSLKSIGEILSGMYSDNGVAGRIGGDEFACAGVIDKNDSVDIIIDRINSKFADFNRVSDKQYKVEISIGGCVLDDTDITTISRALEIADENLYKAKKKRTKNIFK